MIITYVLYQRALIYDKCSESFTVVLFESVDLQTKSTSFDQFMRLGNKLEIAFGISKHLSAEPSILGI